MTIEQTIKKAIDGGYMGKKWGTSGYASLGKTPYLECVLLDPSFWQALGKALGWLKYTRTDGCSADNPDTNELIRWQDSWKYQMHSFIDHLIEGKSAESYFKEL